jgi:hypothetical protein
MTCRSYGISQQKAPEFDLTIHGRRHAALATGDLF